MKGVWQILLCVGRGNETSYVKQGGAKQVMPREGEYINTWMAHHLADELFLI